MSDAMGFGFFMGFVTALATLFLMGATACVCRNAAADHDKRRLERIWRTTEKDNENTDIR